MIASIMFAISPQPIPRAGGATRVSNYHSGHKKQVEYHRKGNGHHSHERRLEAEEVMTVRLLSL